LPSGFHEATESGLLGHPLLLRPRRKPPVDCTGGNVPEGSGTGEEDCAVPHFPMISQPSLPCEDSAFANPCGPGDSHLRYQHSAALNRRIVTNLNKVVQARMGADFGVSKASAVDATECPNPGAVFNENASPLRNRRAVAIPVGWEVPEALRTDDGTGAYMDMALENRASEDANSWFELAVRPQLDADANKSLGPNGAIVGDAGARFNHGERSDAHPLSELDALVDDGAWVDRHVALAGRTEVVEERCEGCLWVVNKKEVSPTSGISQVGRVPNNESGGAVGAPARCVGAKEDGDFVGRRLGWIRNVVDEACPVPPAEASPDEGREFSGAGRHSTTR